MIGKTGFLLLNKINVLLMPWFIPEKSVWSNICNSFKKLLIKWILHAIGLI